MEVGATTQGVICADAISAGCLRLDRVDTFSTFTRKDLNSGSCWLASPTNGISVLAMKPGLVRPLKAKWLGMPVEPVLVVSRNARRHPKPGVDLPFLCF